MRLHMVCIRFIKYKIIIAYLPLFVNIRVIFLSAFHLDLMQILQIVCNSICMNFRKNPLDNRPKKVYYGYKGQTPDQRRKYIWKIQLSANVRT